MFDFVIFAPWPRGLYLVKKLSERGSKTAYVEFLPRIKNPFALFLDESLIEKKTFLESLGFLSNQEGGFCILSPEGVWPLQSMREMTDRLPVLSNRLNTDSYNDFKTHWLAYLSLNMAGKVFEYNNSEFSDKNLNLFSDYFLFDPSFKKAEQFQKDHPDIAFYKSHPTDISFKEKESEFLFKDESLTAKKYFFLGGHHPHFFKKLRAYEPFWQWSAYFFEVDFRGYEEIIPSHFVSLKNLLLPWSHDNLLSIFRRDGQLEVWLKQPYHGENRQFLKDVMEHLSIFFPGCIFSPIERPPLKGPIIYGRESLKLKSDVLKDKVYIENLNDFFQIDLVSEIQAEHKLFETFYHLGKV